MSKFAQKVKEWYEHGNWKLSQVVTAYEKGKLTPEEYAWIIGEVEEE